MKREVALGLVIGVLVVAISSIAFADFSSLFSTGPRIIATKADPLKVFPGQTLKVSVEVEDSSGIINAVSRFNHEKGFDEVPMMMIASNEKAHRYTFQAQWEAHDTLHEKWYTTDFEITSRKGQKLTGTVDWKDPAVSHNAEEILPGNFTNGEYVFPGTANVSTLTLENSLSTTDCTKVTGGSGLCDGSDAFGSCSFFSNSCASTTTCTSTSTGGSTRLTGGVCDCNGAAVTDQTFSASAGGFSGTISCTCSAVTTVVATAIGCS